MIRVETHGFPEAEAKLRRTGERLADPVLALAPELEALTIEERAVFAELGGEFVDTGRTERSLTELGGPDAIREVTPLGLVFGTSVPYARFERKDGRNAVMVDMTEERVSGVGGRILGRIVD